MALPFLSPVIYSTTGDCTCTGPTPDGIVSVYISGGTGPYTAQIIAPYTGAFYGLSLDDVISNSLSLSASYKLNV